MGEGFLHGHEDSETVVLKDLVRGSFMEIQYGFRNGLKFRFGELFTEVFHCKTKCDIN